MLRPKNILVGLDDSPAARNALTQAVDLALWSKGGVTALTVTPPYEGDLSLVGVKQIRNVLSGFDGPIPADILESVRGCGVPLREAHAQGDPADEMVRWTEGNPCDLIVLGVNEPFSFYRAFLQSILSRVIATSSRSLLFVPQGCRMSWEKTVLFLPHRVSAHSWQQFLNDASHFAVSFGGSITAAAALFPIPREPQPSEPMVRTCFDPGTFADGFGASSKQTGSPWNNEVMVNGRMSQNIEWIRSRSPGVIFTGMPLVKGLASLRARRKLEHLIRSSVCPIWVHKTG